MNYNTTTPSPLPNSSDTSSKPAPSPPADESPNEATVRLMRLRERAQVITNKLQYERPLTAEARDFLLQELCQIDEQIESFH